MRRQQQGYFLILAVILVLVIGVMGILIASTYATRARINVAQQQGLQTFYIAEAGLEVASRLLVGTALVSGQSVSCATLTGSPLLTNASMLGGTFTATAIGGALYSASTTLTGAITATSNSLTVASTAGLAAHGRVRIDNEAIDYASLSGTTLIGLNRGVAGTTAAAHALNAAVSESVCLVDVQAGIPSIASPTYQRELQMAVEVLTGTNTVWAVAARHGNQFSIVRWNTPIANAWNDVSPASDTANREDLESVSLSSLTNGWAVGVQKGNNYTMVRWDGTNWTSSPVVGTCSSGQTLYGVKTMSTLEAWAVGEQYRVGCSSGNYGYSIMRWNGSTWTRLTNLTTPSVPATGSVAANYPNLNAVDAIDTNNDGLANLAIAVGNSGAVMIYNGSTWTRSTVGSAALNSVDVVSTSEAWAVGAGGTILRWNGSTWSTVTSPVVGATYNSISMYAPSGATSATAGWAVGNNGVIIYYNGSTWVSQTSNTTNTLSGVTATSATTAFVVGASNTLLLYSGGSWSAATPPTSFTATYYAICSLPGTGSSPTGTQVGSWQQVFH